MERAAIEKCVSHYCSAAATAGGGVGLPALFGFLGVFLQVDVAVHAFDPGQGDEVVLAVGAVVFGQFERAAFEVIDLADGFATGSDDAHVFLDAGDSGVGALGAAAHAGLFLDKLGGLFAPFGDLVAHVLRGVNDGMPGVRDFFLDGRCGNAHSVGGSDLSLS
jgi:hypothetical protein